MKITTRIMFDARGHCRCYEHLAHDTPAIASISDKQIDCLYLECYQGCG